MVLPHNEWWNTDREGEVTTDEILEYKRGRILHDQLGCTDCRYCEEQDGKFYCTAHPEEIEVEEADSCDDFDNHTDWEQEYRMETNTWARY